MDIFEKAKIQFQSKLPFVLFAEPHNNKLKSYFQENDVLHEFTEQSGFVFVSFDGEKKCVLPAESSAIFEEEINFNFDFKSDAIQLSSSFADQSHFENIVCKSIEAIKSGAFEKLVLSRKLDFSDKIDVFESYKKLLKTYPSAFRYLFFHPTIGMWMGATPEQLIKIHANNFETVALAGTQLFSENIKWTSKEIQEQQYVTDFIVSNCKNVATSVQVSEPYTVKAGNLAHIKTKISGVLDTQKDLELISKLHPTPAVCGLPKEKAKSFIKAHEAYDRKFYAGFIGEWHMYETSNLFVNLRCVEIGTTNSIYVGCGITKDSIPEKEYIETQNKSETISNIIIKI